jgi:formylglycine-generating enzyme required for sulfatase activity
MIACGAADVTAAPPSCEAAGPGAGNDCGPSGATDCCDNRLVPCGAHYRSYDGVTFNVKDYPASLSDFRLDTFELTVGRFRAFVDAGKGTQADPPAPGDGAHPKIPESGWDPAWTRTLAATTQELDARLHCSPEHETWTSAPGANERLPMSCITWFEAFAFCAWDGGRLPTEAEWDRAAAGGDEQREYPWGSGIDDTRAVYGCVGGQCPFSFLPEVGSRSPQGDGRWGQADLAGSVAEWTLDWFYVTYEFSDDCVDCAAIFGGTRRVLRGGSYVLGAPALRSGERSPVLLGNGTFTEGVRCARQP